MDDDADIRQALTSCFEGVGCTVVSACDGLDALDQLARAPRPCFMLLDLNMPRLDGGGLARRVCASPCHRDLPIVTMSAGHDPPPPTGLGAHLEKPFDFGVLVPIVERLCRDPDWLHGRRCRG